jgi:hypothetical protein
MRPCRGVTSVTGRPHNESEERLGRSCYFGHGYEVPGVPGVPGTIVGGVPGITVSGVPGELAVAGVPGITVGGVPGFTVSGVPGVPGV